ncbi:MAG: hypothetical protein K940chlam7_01926 [Chlamydiae bacterium]|nr:hypothetical protein [Chlamydiota bacterium]
MRISIAERLKPFSHNPGSYCLLPGSALRLQIFPTLICIHDLSEVESPLICEISFPLHGPVKDFTLQQDLEKGCVRIWGCYKEGFVRYSIFPVEEKVCAIFIDKCPEGGIPFSCLVRPAKEKETIVIRDGSASVEDASRAFFQVQERLSLGSHKAQDWDLVGRRSDLREIFPVWLRLGQLVPQQQSCKRLGSVVLLNHCEELIASRTREEIFQSFLNLFHAGFEGILSPRLIDTQHQGLGVPKLENGQQGSPLVLLSEGAALIRTLFLDVKGKEIKVLPSLPPEFHCGRYINIDCEGIGTLDLEWSKKTIRRMIFRASSDKKITFSFQKQIKKFRLRESLKDRGTYLELGGGIEVRSGGVYCFDNFRK